MAGAGLRPHDHRPAHARPRRDGPRARGPRRAAGDGGHRPDRPRLGGDGGRSDEAGAFDYLRKPIGSPGELRLLVSRALERRTLLALRARTIHALSPRPKGPFVARSCAAIAEGVLEGELFGHERGVFTSALATRRGRIELADGGTLFLDETGELKLELQSKRRRSS